MIVIGHLYKFTNMSCELPPLVDSFSVTNAGVDIFILISGLFGIRFSVKRALNIWYTVVYYGLVGGVIGCILVDAPVYKVVTNVLKASSIVYSGLWFVVTYFALMFFASLINHLFTFPKKQQLMYLIILLIVDCGFQNVAGGFYSLTLFGGALLHFITLYVLARVITLWNIRCRPSKALLGFIGISLVIYHLRYIPVTYLECDFSAYFCLDTSPLILLQSVFLVLFFKEIPQKSNCTINYIATLAFSVYCFHAHHFVHETITRFCVPGFYSTYLSTGVSGLFAVILLCAFLIYATTIILEELRKRLFGRIEAKITDLVERKIHSIQIS